jgi:hypothetical protein
MEGEALSHKMFVIHAGRRSGMADLKDRLHPIGSLEVMNGPDPGFVLHLWQSEGEPRFIWQTIRGLVGENIEVHPVLLDPEGDPHYPTGRINVRFSRAPNEAEIEHFARAHNLETRSRNKFIPSQFVFEPRESSSVYLPDVLNQIRSEESVKAVWADTVSRYKRV